MPRRYANWELCDLNMSGIHTWQLVSELAQGEKKKSLTVKCHRCLQPPPSSHKSRLLIELLEAKEVEAEMRRRARTLRLTMRGAPAK